MSATIDNSNSFSADQVWGPWVTAAFGLLVAASFIMVQFIVLIVFLVAGSGGDGEIPQRMQVLSKDGNVLSVATIATGLVCSALVLLLAYARRGAPVRQYLLLVKPAMRQFLPWFILIVLVAVAYDFSKLLFDKPVVPEVMIEIYRSVTIKPLFWLAIIVLGPLFEELFFRGFLMTGLMQSRRLGAVGAVLITSVTWALVHQQYETMDILWILVIGILLGITRLRTQSLVPCIAIHMAMNLTATLETAYYA